MNNKHTILSIMLVFGFLIAILFIFWGGFSIYDCFHNGITPDDAECFGILGAIGYICLIGGIQGLGFHR